jgi:membrane protease YdiL (CAAX protease family)
MSTIIKSHAREMPLAHAGLALVLLGSGLLATDLLAWPFHILAPLAAYVLIVALVPPLRRSLSWLRVGRLDRNVWIATAMVVVVSSATLMIWHHYARPNVSSLVGRFPKGSVSVLVLVGVAFAMGNALLEEVLFRGLLYDALRSGYGVVTALCIQAVAFGTFHLHGFPSGLVGVGLATAYGFMLGGLRVWTGGLGACWVAHVLADATIFVLLVR